MLRHAVPVCFMLLVCCIAVTFAEEPTTEQVIAAARVAAMEAQDRNAMLRLAEIALATDPAQALSDLQEAAQMPGPSRNAQVDGSSTIQLARGLTALGDEETAVRVLRAELRSLIAGDVPGQVHEIATLATRISRLAGAISATDVELAGSALHKVEADMLPRVNDDYFRQSIVTELAAARARSAPDEASLLFARECPGRPIAASLLLSIIETDPDAVMIHLPAIASHQVAIGDGHDAREVQFALVGALMRQDMNRAMLLARQFGIANFVEFDFRLTRHIARALGEVGIESLPADAGTSPLLRGAATGLARVNPAMALELARRIEPEGLQAPVYAQIAACAADDAPEIAREAACRALATSEMRDPSASFGPAAAALAPVDVALAAELMRKIERFSHFAPAFDALFRHDPAAAEALIADLSPEHQLMAFASMVALAENLGEDRRREIIEQALDMPAASAGGAAACRIIAEVARFDPDRARQEWQSLNYLDVTTAEAQVVADRLGVLVAVAEAFEERERGSSELEVDVIRDTVLAAPPGAEWAPLFIARLAGIYANYDGPAAKAAAEQVLADLANSASWRKSEAEAAAAALAALSRVDMRGTRAVIEGSNDLNRPEQLGAIVTEIARRRPEFACQMVSDLVPPGGIDVMLRHTLSVVGAEEDEAVGAELISSWMAAPTFREPNSHGFLMTGALNSARDPIIDLLPQRLDTIDDPRMIANILEHTAASSMVFATDRLLGYLLQRLEGAEPRHTRRALVPLSAAVAERRWEDGAAMIEALPVSDRPTALLLVLRMREHRRDVLQARRVIAAAQEG
ncbi:MAG: hypothetical protein GX131_15390 [candidate division WS1 bacterium]|nr:hypothetical protein [candidate division WS1 bacterium]